MSRDLGTVLVAAVVATVNPSLIAAVTVMLLLPHPKRLMLGYLLGAYATSLAAGLVIVFTLHGSGAVKTSTHLLSPAGDVVIGGVALTVAFVLLTGRDAGLRHLRQRHRHGKVADEQAPWHLRLLGRGSAGVTFVVGAAMSFPGVSYVNALDHIARLNPSTISILLLVLYFCLMQQIVLEGALVASLFAADRTQDVIVRTKAWLTEHGHQLATIGLSAVGTLLVVRGLAKII